MRPFPKSQVIVFNNVSLALSANNLVLIYLRLSVYINSVLLFSKIYIPGKNLSNSLSKNIIINF